jgi:hypothetical protein
MAQTICKADRVRRRRQWQIIKLLMAVAAGFALVLAASAMRG